MSDCPHCDWWYDPTADALLARPVGESMPLLYVDGRMFQATPAEGINPKANAAAAHICFQHPMEPEVLIFGPVERWYPLAGLNRLLSTATLPALLFGSGFGSRR